MSGKEVLRTSSPQSPFRTWRCFHRVPEVEGGHDGTSGDIPPLVVMDSPLAFRPGPMGKGPGENGSGEGQELKARPCFLNARGLLARGEADPLFLPSILPPYHRRAGTAGTPWASRRHAVGPGSRQEHPAGTLKSPVIACWKSFQSDTERILPPFFPALPFCPRLGCPVVFCFRSLRVRGRGFRCSLLTRTCPVGRDGGEPRVERVGPALHLRRLRWLYFLADADRQCLPEGGGGGLDPAGKLRGWGEGTR